MTGQDGLRDELVAALEAIDNLADNYELADRLLPVVQRHIDDAREQDLAAIETQIAEHVTTRTQAAREQVAEEIAQALAAVPGEVYPEDVFEPIGSDDAELIQGYLKELELPSMDRIGANAMRRAYRQAATIARQHAEAQP